MTTHPEVRTNPTDTAVEPDPAPAATTGEHDDVRGFLLTLACLSPELLGLRQAVVRQACTPIDYNEWPAERLQALVRGMFALQYQYGGVGLAAPQVGLSLQLAVIDSRADPPLVLVNPRIVERSEETATEVEGCLSLPGVAGPVERALGVTVEACDPLGRPFTLTAQGLLARIIQHEVDHLQGVLFPDRLRGGDVLQRLEGPDALTRRAVQQVYGRSIA
jgi:peptide deformylase